MPSRPRGSRRAGFHGPREVARRVVTETITRASPSPAISAMMSRSRRISADFVTMPVGWRASRSTSRILPGDAEVTLDRLIWIGVRAERQRTDPVTGLPEFAPQQVRRLRLGHDLGLEVEAGREPQVLVARPREAVDAAVLAAAIGVDGPVERDVRRVVPGDDRLRPVDDDFRRNALGRGIARIPPVVERLLAQRLEPPGGVGQGPRPRRGFPRPPGSTAALFRLEGVERAREGGFDLRGITGGADQLSPLISAR